MQPFFLFCGPNVLQGREHALRLADRIAHIKHARNIEVPSLHVNPLRVDELFFMLCADTFPQAGLCVRLYACVRACGCACVHACMRAYTKSIYQKATRTGDFQGIV